MEILCFGFFDSHSEFTESNVDVIDKQCESTKGYCYIPPDTLAQMHYAGKRFRANTQFAKDILYFVQNGRMP